MLPFFVSLFCFVRLLDAWSDPLGSAAASGCVASQKHLSLSMHGASYAPLPAHGRSRPGRFFFALFRRWITESKKEVLP
jgi:hypothetical protein